MWLICKMFEVPLNLNIEDINVSKKTTLTISILHFEEHLTNKNDIGMHVNTIDADADNKRVQRVNSCL